MNTTTLTVECSAKTTRGQWIALPEGAEVQASAQECIAAMNAAPSRSGTVKFMVRCPRAKNPAPYEIDISDLWLAVR